ncbi:MAG: YjiH family protein, partial [Corynebacterium casei]
FAALVPCIMATRIPVSIPQMLLIWFERVALTIVIATPIAHLIL